MKKLITHTTSVNTINNGNPVSEVDVKKSFPLTAITVPKPLVPKIEIICEAKNITTIKDEKLAIPFVIILGTSLEFFIVPAPIPYAMPKATKIMPIIGTIPDIKGDLGRILPSFALKKPSDGIVITIINAITIPPAITA